MTYARTWVIIAVLNQHFGPFCKVKTASDLCWTTAQQHATTESLMNTLSIVITTQREDSFPAKVIVGTNPMCYILFAVCGLSTSDLFLAPRHRKKLFPVQLRTKLLFQLPDAVKNKPRKQTHTHTHEKDTTWHNMTQPCAAAPTSTGSFKRRSKLHVTTLRYARHCVGSWASPIASWVCRLSCWALDHDRCLLSESNLQRLLWWYSPLIQRNFGTWGQYFWTVLPRIWRHSIHLPLIGPLYVQE